MYKSTSHEIHICKKKVFTLPDDFNFPHYFCMCLDAHTVDLVDVMPTSYIVVIVVVIMSEFLIRFQGPSLESLHLWEINPTSTIYLFVLFGIFLLMSYFALYRICAKSLMNVLKVKFGCQKYSFIGISLKNRLELHAARSSSGRSLTDLHTELRPFLDRTYFEGVEEEEELEKNPESDVVCIDLFSLHYTTTTTT
jgi:hypothetical protein